MEKLGYDKPFSSDKEQTELYMYNPQTRSTITFDFTPAGRYARFNQKNMEILASMGTESMKAELDKEFGKGVIIPDVYPTEPISLKGVQYAAKKYATYTARGMKQEQGWMVSQQIPFDLFFHAFKNRDDWSYHSGITECSVITQEGYRTFKIPVEPVLLEQDGQAPCCFPAFCQEYQILLKPRAELAALCICLRDK